MNKLTFLRKTCLESRGTNLPYSTALLSPSSGQTVQWLPQQRSQHSRTRGTCFSDLLLQSVNPYQAVLPQFLSGPFLLFCKVFSRILQKRKQILRLICEHRSAGCNGFERRERFAVVIIVGQKPTEYESAAQCDSPLQVHNKGAYQRLEQVPHSVGRGVSNIYHTTQTHATSVDSWNKLMLCSISAAFTKEEGREGSKFLFLQICSHLSGGGGGPPPPRKDGHMTQIIAGCAA